MGIYIGMFEFDGPNIMPPDLMDKPGVFAVVHQFMGELELLSVGHPIVCNISNRSSRRRENFHRSSYRA